MTTKPVNELHRSTLITLMGSVFVGYPISIALLGQSDAIEIGNIILASLALGVAVAYSPVALAVARYKVLDGASVLSFGIWIGWVSIFYRTGGAIAWRFFDKPDGWIDSALWGLHIAGTCSAALCHLLGPEAMNGRVPTKQWIRVGAIVAAAALVAGVITSVNFN